MRKKDEKLNYEGINQELIVMCEIIKDMARKWKKRLREEHANYNQRKKNKRGK